MALPDLCQLARPGAQVKQRTGVSAARRGAAGVLGSASGSHEIPPEFQEAGE